MLKRRLTRSRLNFEIEILGDICSVCVIGWGRPRGAMEAARALEKVQSANNFKNSALDEFSDSELVVPQTSVAITAVSPKQQKNIY
jgi:hypothetical protein